MTIYSLLAVAYYPYVQNAASLILQNVLITTTIVALILLTTLSNAPVLDVLRRFYIIPVIYLMYGQVHALVPAVHPVDYDSLLIQADRILTGGIDPTVWLAQYTWPLLTEFLQICYFLFYMLPIMQAVELYRRGDIEALTRFARAMAFCYFISYLAYFAMPAIGPRFTLHDFHRLNEELPGVFITEWLRDIVNAGGGVAIGTAHPEIVVNRDCMPSGHTMLTLVNIMMGFRNQSRLRWVFVLIGGSLIVATVYLRYHYVVDLLIGALFAVVFLALEPYCNRFIINRLQKVIPRM
jgi:membrane-associated phospholipid phosphatase